MTNGVKLTGCIAQSATAIRIGTDGLRVSFDFPETELEKIKCLMDMRDVCLDVVVVRHGLLDKSEEMGRNEQ